MRGRIGDEVRRLLAFAPPEASLKNLFFMQILASKFPSVLPPMTKILGTALFSA
jgi:hypothetical protein